MRFVDPVFEKKAYEDLETDKHYIIKKIRFFIFSGSKLLQNGKIPNRSSRSDKEIIPDILYVFSEATRMRRKKIYISGLNQM